MTNTKFRKRALLSSVAMLLVALVALGSATFAWFVDDPNVTATGISAKANTALGLVAQTTTDGWGTSTWKHDPALGKTLGDSILVDVTPVEATSAIEWFNAAGTSFTNGAIDAATGKKWTKKTAGTAGEQVTGGIYYEQIKFKLEGGATTADLKLTGCTVTGSGDSLANSVTVAFAYNNKIIAMFNKGTADSTTPKWTGLNNGDQTAAAASGSTWSIHKSGTVTPIDIASFTTAGQEITLDIYVFLDGGNANTKSSNAVTSQLVSSIVPTFTAVAPTT